VVLEGLMREQHTQGLQRLGSGLLLLSILLSAADPPVRLAFQAGVPGEVLLRLLGRIAGVGATQEGGTPTTPPCSPRIFQQWQVQGVGPPGATGLSAALAQGEGALSVIPSRQSALQVLLWCFFEVAPPQQQQQQEEKEEEQVSDQEAAESSSSSESVVPGVQQVQRLLQAAQGGAVWVPGSGEWGLMVA
jgi:hypothetical protein